MFTTHGPPWCLCSLARGVEWEKILTTYHSSLNCKVLAIASQLYLDLFMYRTFYGKGSILGLLSYAVLAC